MVKLNQMGAQLPEVSAELTNLAQLALFYGTLAMWRYRPAPEGDIQDADGREGTASSR